MDSKAIPVEKPEDMNFILGQAHFIKTVEDLHEAIVTTAPHMKFGIAFCESSGLALVRHTGNDEALVEIAVKNALAVGRRALVLHLPDRRLPGQHPQRGQGRARGLRHLLRHGQSGRGRRRRDRARPGHPRCRRRRPDEGRRGTGRHRVAQGLPAHRSATSSEPAQREYSPPPASGRPGSRRSGRSWPPPSAPSSATISTGPELAVDPAGAAGWTWVSGEGRAVMDFVQGPGLPRSSSMPPGTGATSGGPSSSGMSRPSLDLARLARPGFELRVEARIRTDHAPRRVNLHLNTQKTKDFHSHLMEYDLAETGPLVHDQPDHPRLRGGARRYGQRPDGPDGLGPRPLSRRRRLFQGRRGRGRPGPAPTWARPIPYHPPVADPASFARGAAVAADLTVDLGEPAVNLNDWTIRRRRRRSARRLGRRDAPRPPPLGPPPDRREEGRRAGPPRADDARPRALGGRSVPISASSASSRSSAAIPPGTNKRPRGPRSPAERRASSC